MICGFLRLLIPGSKEPTRPYRKPTLLRQGGGSTPTFMCQEVNQPFSELESGVFYWKIRPVCFGCAAVHPRGSCAPAAIPWLGSFMPEVSWQRVGAGTYQPHAKIIHLGLFGFFFFFPMKNQNFLCKMRHDFSGVGEDGVLVQGEEILYLKKKKKTP